MALMANGSRGDGWKGGVRPIWVDEFIWSGWGGVGARVVRFQREMKVSPPTAPV